MMSLAQNLNLVVTDITNYEGPPLPGFQLGATISNGGEIPLALLNISFTVRTKKHLIRIQPERSCAVSAIEPRLGAGKMIRIYLPVTFTREVLDAIESKRLPDGEIELEIMAYALVAPLASRQFDNGKTSPVLGEPQRVHSDVRNSDGSGNTYRISRDTWLGALTSFRFSETDVFELPVHDLKAKGLPEQALTSLHDGERAFRGGDWDGTLTKFRGAFEAVATATGGSSNVVAGFEKLWSALLPDDVDDAKRKTLNELIGAFANFQHLGRHKKFPFTPVDRVDALLVLRISLSLFEYMGARSSR